METKKGRYDTNPLDPDYLRHAEDEWSEGDGGHGTREMKGATREVGSSPSDSARSNIYSEAPTKTFDTPPLDSPYPSVFVPPTIHPGAYQALLICLINYSEAHLAPRGRVGIPENGR